MSNLRARVERLERRAPPPDPTAERIAAGLARLEHRAAHGDPQAAAHLARARELLAIAEQRRAEAQA